MLPPNLLAVLAAAAAGYVLGALWYSPLLFAKSWMKLAGIKDRRGAAASYVINFLSMLIMSYVLGHVLKAIGAATVLDGLKAGFWLWAGFMATVTLTGVLWERKPLGLYLINNGYNLLALMLMGVIQVLWP